MMYHIDHVGLGHKLDGKAASLTWVGASVGEDVGACPQGEQYSSLKNRDVGSLFTCNLLPPPLAKA